MEHNEIHSPVEVDEGGWRGRVVGVTRIGAKAGFAAALVLAVLFGMIVYGISTAGHRRAANANGSTALTKASEQQKPWWNAFPDAQQSPPLLPSAPPVPARVPPLTASTQTARTSEDAQLSAARMQALEAEQEREQRRRALLDAAAMAPVAVRLNDGAPPTPGNSSQGVPGTQPTPSVPAIGPNSGYSQMGAAGSSHDQLFAALQDDPSPYVLHAGSVIPATLLTGINAELPGTIEAQVRQDVFDSVTGQYLLVPRGTKLIGSYDSRIVQGHAASWRTCRIRSREHNISVDEHVEQVSLRYFERGRNLQLALRELNARVANLLSDGSGDRLTDAGSRVHAPRLLRLAQLGAGADDAQQ